jgi:hypothetical protein
LPANWYHLSGFISIFCEITQCFERPSRANSFEFAHNIAIRKVIFIFRKIVFENLRATADSSIESSFNIFKFVATGVDCDNRPDCISLFWDIVKVKGDGLIVSITFARLVVT